MKNCYKLLCVLVSVIFAVSCSDELDSIDSISHGENLKSLYEANKTDNKISALTLLNNGTRSSGALYKDIVVLTKENMDKLSGMSEEKILELKRNIISSFGDNADVVVDSVLNCRMENLYYQLGGSEGLEKFITFTDEYLSSAEVWESVEGCLPVNMTSMEQQFFIVAAAKIDLMARPIVQYLSHSINSSTRSFEDDDMYCKFKLKRDLGLMAGELTVEEFLDMMSGGTTTPVDCLVDGAELLSIWLDYEVCNGRFH